MTDLWTVLSSRVTSGPLGESVKKVALAQVWCHAVTDTARLSDRVWVAGHALLDGDTRAAVLASTEGDVQRAAVANPAVTTGQRQVLLRSRTGLSLLRHGLSSANDVCVAADLLGELLHRWPRMAPRTRASFVAPAAHAMHIASSPVEGEEFDAEQMRTLVRAVADVVIVPALTDGREGARNVGGRITRGRPTWPLHPQFLRQLLPHVSEEALAGALSQPRVRPELAWSILALAPHLPWSTAVQALQPMLTCPGWTAQLRQPLSALSGLAPWALRYPRQVLNLLTHYGMTAADAELTQEGLMWRDLAYLAELCLVDVEHADLDRLTTRLNLATSTMHPSWADVDAARALAQHPQAAVRQQLSAWAHWYDQEPDEATAAAIATGREYLLVASGADHVFHALRLIEALTESDTEAGDLAARVLQVMLEHAPNAVSPELLGAAGRAGVLMAPWPLLSSAMDAGGRLLCREAQLDVTDLFVLACVEHLTGADDWEVLARLAETWHGSTGELLDAVAALRDQ